MKKRHLLLCLFVMLAGVFTSVFAGTGASRTDAIDFDLKTQTLKQGNQSLWYKMDLSAFPTSDAIQLVVSNQSDDNVTISVAVYTTVEAEAASVVQSKTVPLEGTLTASIPAGLNAMYPQVYLQLTSSKNVAVAATSVPTPEGVGCKFPVKMAYQPATKDWAPVSLDANDPKVLRIDGLQTLKEEPVDMVNRKAYGLKVTIYNNGAAEATVKAGLMLSCGAVLQDMSRTIASGESKSATIKYSMVQQLKADSVFVDMSSDQDITVKIEADQQDVKVSNGAKYAVHADFDTPYATTKALTPSDSTNGGSKKHWFRIFVKEGQSRAAKMDKDSVLKIIYTNNSGTPLEISENYKYSSDPAKVLSEEKYKVAAHGKASHSLSSTQIRQLKVDSIFYYIDADKTGDFTVEWKLDAAEPGSVCRAAIGYVLPSDKSVISFKHKSANTVWYKIDYAAAMAINNGAIKLSIKNNSASNGTLSADVKFDCDGSATPQTKGISAGQSMSKTIGHALLESFSGEGTSVYVGLSTELDVTISAQLVEEALSEDRACLEAQNITLKADANSVFNFTPKVVGKPDTAWYYIDLAALKADPHDLKVTLTGSGAIKVDGALAFSCPATSMQEKSLSFSNKYEKTVAYSQLASLKNPYVRIISTKAVAVLLEPQVAETHIIDLCNDANVVDVKPINNDPHSITANYDSAWFHINVKALRDSLKTNRVYVVYSSPKQTVNAGSSSVCNMQYALSYQKQSLSNGTKVKKEITADRLDLVGEADEIWVNVKAEQAYQFELLFEPIPVGSDCEHAEEFKPGVDYTQAAGEGKWFVVKVKDLRALGQNATLTLSNSDAKYTSLKGTVFNACGGTQLGTQNVGLSANDVKVKTAGLSGYPDQVVVYIESTGNVKYRVDLVNETGEDCSEAILFDWVNGYTVASGTQVWLNVKFSGIQEGDSVVIHATNLSANPAKLNAGVAYSCSEGISQSGSRSLAANEDLNRDVTSMIGSRDSVLIRVNADQAVKLWAEVIKREPLDNPITICSKATQVTYNKWYDVAANTPDQWFLVAVKDLKENTLGDGKFRIQAADDVNFKAEIAYHCPVLYPMTSKTLKVEGGVEYNRAVKRTDINSVTNDSVFILITADKPAKFQLEIQDLAGMDCEHAILYDWGTEYENAAFGSKWYKVPFVDILKNPETGVKVHFENNNASETTVRVAIYGKDDLTGFCLESSLLDSTVAVKENYFKDVYRNHTQVDGLSETLNLDTIFLMIYSENVVKFRAYPYAEVAKIDNNFYCSGEVIDAFGKSFVIDDVMQRDDVSDAILNHQIFNGAYEFMYANDTKSIMIDVDSTYHFQGNMYDVPDFTAAINANPLKPVLLNGNVVEAPIQQDVQDLIDAWNASDDPENDYYVAQISAFAWAKTSDNGISLTLSNNCDDVVLDFVADAYNDNVLPAIDVTSCQVVPNDSVKHLIPGFEAWDVAWYDVQPYNNLSSDVFDPAALNLTVFPYVVGTQVLGIAEANTHASTQIAAYNATDPAVKVLGSAGWNATGDTLWLATDCGDVYVYHAPETQGDVILPALDSIVCPGVTIEPDSIPLTIVEGIQLYTIQPYNAIELNTIDKAVFTPTAQVFVGMHLEGTPSVDYAAALTEANAALVAWNLDPANSPVDPLSVVFNVAPDFSSADLTVVDNCGTQLVVNYTPVVFDVVRNIEHQLGCAADSVADPVVQVAIAGSTATYDSLHAVVTDPYVAVSTATPTFSNVKAGERADGTWSTSEAAALAEIAAFVTTWNADANNSPVSTVPAQFASITATEAALSLTDDCGNVLPIAIPVDFKALVRDTVWSYACAASSTPDTTNIDLGDGASYDSIHVAEVLAFAHATAPKIEGVEAFCGLDIDYVAADAAIKAAIQAQLVEGVASIDLSTLTWTVPAAADVLFGSKANVSYSVLDECGVELKDEVALDVAEPSYDESTVGLSVPMLVDYKGLIVVNKKPLEQAIKDKFGADVVITAEMIHWFKVGQAAELSEADGAKGLYFTPQTVEGFEGFDATQYYITLEVSISGGDNCHSTFTSVPVVGTVAGAPKMFIAPNSVNPGETITLYNLDGKEAVLAVYDMMGNLTSQETISGVSSYSFQAQSNSGYYVVKVVNGERVESLKYVVK